MLVDVYPYLKHTSLQAFNMIAAAEDSVPGINGGAVYLQNAAPDGAIAYALAEVMERVRTYQ